MLLGVRHHGPGSARAVRRALAAYQPRGACSIEGPPEADALVRLAGDEEMRPPVALLAYPATPGGRRPPPARRAAFWPFAEFSPEWQALRWALGRATCRCGSSTCRRRPCGLARSGDPPDADDAPTPTRACAADPIGVLAAAAGYDDPERWWEDVVEHRLDHADGDDLDVALAPFEAIAEAMAAVRAAAPAPPRPSGSTRSGARRTCAPALRAATQGSTSGSPWSAAPGTCRR